MGKCRIFRTFVRDFFLYNHGLSRNIVIFAEETQNQGETMKKLTGIIERYMMLVMLFGVVMPLTAQQVVSGTVSDEDGHRLAQVNVSAGGKSVVTNEDGAFTLKTTESAKSVVFSHLGYRTLRLSINGNGQPLTVRMKPMVIALHEIVVNPNNAEELLMTAIEKIPENYSRQPELFDCFYRETAMKRKHYIYVAEGIIDMYKTEYKRGVTRDRVAIVKGRRLLSAKQSDTLGVKVMGGPVQAINLDIVKNRDFLFNKDELKSYHIALDGTAMIADRQHYVIALSPMYRKEYALFFGKVYVDKETLSISRVELQLDMSDRDQATSFMLIKKPVGVRFKPRELTCLVDYKTEDGVTRISYIRNVFRFHCDWKKQLLSTSFTAVCEMVVTNRPADRTAPIPGRLSFDSRDAYYDKVDFFRDPEFWKDYNIIEPSESLDKAIGQLVKRHNKP